MNEETNRKACYLFLGVASACKFANTGSVLYLLLGVVLFYYGLSTDPDEGGSDAK